jgi:hypothetical protein
MRVEGTKLFSTLAVLPVFAAEKISDSLSTAGL